MPERRTGPNHARIDRVGADARSAREKRSKGYRKQARRRKVVPRAARTHAKSIASRSRSARTPRSLP